MGGGCGDDAAAANGEAYVGQKFRNMLSHLEHTHPQLVDRRIKLLRFVPDRILAQQLRTNLLPQRHLLSTADGVKRAQAQCPDPTVARIIGAVNTDPKLKRYCELFIRVLEPAAAVEKPRASWFGSSWLPSMPRRLKNFLYWRVESDDDENMNKSDPTDMANVSVEGVGERLYLSRAAEDVRKSGPQQKGGSSKGAPPPPAAPSAASAKKPSAAELQQMKEETEYEIRQSLLDKIGKYRERFTKLKKRNGSLNIKSSLIELSDEVHYIEQQLGREEGPAGSLKPANMCFVASMYGIEHGTNVYNPLGLKLSGLGQTTQQSIQQFEPLLDEFMIKHSMDLTASVEFRIIMMIVTTVATVHMANSGHGADILSKLNAAQPGDEADL